LSSEDFDAMEDSFFIQVESWRWALWGRLARLLCYSDLGSQVWVHWMTHLNTKQKADLLHILKSKKMSLCLTVHWVYSVIVLVNDQSLTKRPWISDIGLITTTVRSEIKDLSRVHESLSRTLYLVGVLVHNNITR
jgi:hypothetical protein